MKPLISIITPNYNAEKFIIETIESVLNQTYEHWEWIIVDDVSTDASVTIIEKHQAQDARIQLVKSASNGGPAKSRNKGIDLAKGDFMTFLDADDLWLPEFLEISLKFVQESEGFVFSSYHRVDENLKPMYQDFVVPKKVSYTDILKTNSISCLTAFIDIKRLGKYKMPDVLYRQDMGLWLIYLKKIDYALGYQKPMALYRIRKDSHSRNKIKLLKHQWCFYRNVVHLTVIQSGFYFTFWMVNGFFKYLR